MKNIEGRVFVPPMFKLSGEELLKSYTIEEFKGVLYIMVWSPLLQFNLLRLIDELEALEAYEWCFIIKNWLDIGSDDIK